jgi:hypothetical protein
MGRSAVILILLHMIIWWALWIKNSAWIDAAIMMTGPYSYPTLYANSDGTWLGKSSVGYGEVAGLLLAVMAGLAVDSVRRKRFELFYITHILLFVPGT